MNLQFIISSMELTTGPQNVKKVSTLLLASTSIKSTGTLLNSRSPWATGYFYPVDLSPVFSLIGFK